MKSESEFQALPRNQFRDYFQPSRVLLGIVPAPTKSGVNVITLCFNMHCAYRPTAMAFAVHNRSASFGLFQAADEFVLAVPGPKLVDAAILCGTRSMRQVDKIEELGLQLVPSGRVKTPGLRLAIANIELKKDRCIEVGDHLLVTGVVRRFGVNRSSSELPLLSIGSRTSGYTILRKSGIHRIAIINGEQANLS